MKPYEKVTVTAVFKTGRRVAYDTTRSSINAMVNTIKKQFGLNLYGVLVETEIIGAEGDDFDYLALSNYNSYWA